MTDCGYNSHIPLPEPIEPPEVCHCGKPTREPDGTNVRYDFCNDCNAFRCDAPTEESSWGCWDWV